MKIINNYIAFEIFITLSGLLINEVCGNSIAKKKKTLQNTCFDVLCETTGANVFVFHRVYMETLWTHGMCSPLGFIE